MSVTIKTNSSPEKIKKQLDTIAEQEKAKRIEKLKPFFGILKGDIDPLKLQRKWRNEWK